MKKTLFKPAKNKYLAKIVSFESPAKARLSVRDLKNEYNEAQTQTKKLRVARATQLASNRARAAANRQNLSAKERREYREIARIYNTAAEQMYKRYR